MFAASRENGVRARVPDEEGAGLRGGRLDEMVPEGVDAGFGGVAVEADAVWVAGGSVHDGPGCAAGGVDLETEVVVQAGDGVVVLVDDEVGGLAGEGGGVEGVVGVDGEEGGWGGESVLGEVGCEVGEGVGDVCFAGFDGGGCWW